MPSFPLSPLLFIHTGGGSWTADMWSGGSEGTDPDPLFPSQCPPQLPPKLGQVRGRQATQSSRQPTSRQVLEATNKVSAGSGELFNLFVPGFAMLARTPAAPLFGVKHQPCVASLSVPRLLIKLEEVSIRPDERGMLVHLSGSICILFKLYVFGS